MKKEIIIAILVGLSMGLIITFGVYRVKSSITEAPTTSLEDDPDQNKATTAPTILALHSPEDGTVQIEKDLTVTGTTTPNSFIVLFVNNNDFISSTDESGNFSFQVELEDGANILRVHILNEDGETAVEERLVVISDAFEKEEAENLAKEETEETTEENEENNEN